MTPEWFPVIPGSGIFFAGDRIRADIAGRVIEGVIEDFSRDAVALLNGAHGDTARVRLTTGDLALIPVAAITAVAIEAAAR